ncbi:uncharacterized protein [Oscarella lobularis]|uniref:uncharacterized protein isoform X3 n=1 Tax=Oscarella lobularis TaxID=121494 RepID=UPI003313F582
MPFTARCQQSIVPSYEIRNTSSVVSDFEEPAFPLNETVQAAIAALHNASAPEPTGFNSTTYLETIKGIVDFFRQHQAPDGSIIDPYENKEMGHSTPCFANAASTLISTGYVTGDSDLVDQASRALTRSLTELATANCSQDQCNFFTMPSLFAYANLKDHVDKKSVGMWDSLLTAIDPKKTYKPASNNWATVALTGEYMRFKMGFTNSTEWLQLVLNDQMKHFTANGQYQDRSGYDSYLNPIPYDHYPRKYLAVMMEMGYNLSYSDALPTLLRRGAWVSLLMQSPWGEMPTGGRSSQHQWNEAVQTVTYELFASKFAKDGDMVTAGAFKRAAHLALGSLRRWRMRNGALYIVKNRFDPKLRHGYETYSYFSNYNLVPAGMLATAILYCNDSIAEGSTPAEVGGFVFDIPEFHKIFVNVGGMYLEYETEADPHYDSTGLTRIHTPNVQPLIMPTSGSAEQSGPLSISPIWYNDTNKSWTSLSQVGYLQGIKYSLTSISASQSKASFSINWMLGNKSEFHYSVLREDVTVTPEKIVTSLVANDRLTPYFGYEFPAFSFDGTHEKRPFFPKRKTFVFLKIRCKCSSGISMQPSCNFASQKIENRNGYLLPVRCYISFSSGVKAEEKYVNEPAFIRYAICPLSSSEGSKACTSF